jgi:PAS domain S-box-containing protein
MEPFIQLATPPPVTDLHVEAADRLSEALVESENRMRRRFDLLSEVVFETDRTGSLIYLNQAWFLALGHATADSIGRPLVDFIMEEDQLLYARILAGATLRTAGQTVRLRRSDGGFAWMEISLSPLDDGGVVGAMHDVTSRKLAEDELAKLSLVASYTENLVVITDAERCIEWVNRAFTVRTGFSLEEVIGRRPGAFLQGGDTDPAAVAQISASLSEGCSFKTELLNYTRWGEPYWVSMQITPIRGADGEIQRYIAVQTDSTELHQTAKELESAKERAEAANEAKTQFLATISHEMRTPLNIILGATELAQESGIEPVDLAAHLRRIDTNADALLRLISDMLDVSKIESGRFDFERVVVPLRACLSATVAPLAERAAAKGVEFKLMFDDGLPSRIMSDPERLRQIVTNLVENAVKFTDRGSVRVEVTRREQEPRGGGWFEIRVVDSGCGISLHEQTRIFGRFEQADSSTTRRKGGVGLGLNIVKSLAEGLGGRVSVHSNPGEGADFRVRLPLEPVADGEPQAASPTPPPRPGPVGLPAREGKGPFKVLIAEDSDANYAIAEIFLTRAGYAVSRASDGLLAVEAAAGVDLILMDIEMPEIDGMEATRRIREAERLASRLPVTIIALSAHGVAGYREACLAAGCSGFLTKPLRPQALCAAVSEALEVGVVHG